MKRYIKSSTEVDQSYIDECISAIRSGKLEYDDEIDAEFVSAGPIYVQFQDRESHSRAFRRDSRRIDKSPRVSTNTWGRVWIDNNLVKNSAGPKMKVRQDIINYLRSNKLD